MFRIGSEIIYKGGEGQGCFGCDFFFCPLRLKLQLFLAWL